MVNDDRASKCSAAEAAKRILVALQDGALTDDAGLALQGLGLQDTQRAHANLRRLADAIPGEVFGGLVARLLRTVAESPDPDMALNNIERLVSGCAGAEELVAAWAESEQALEAVVELCAGSQLLADILQEAEPGFSTLIAKAGPPERLTADQLLAEARGALDVPGGTPARLSVLRRFKRRELLRIASRDILHLASFGELVEEISDLAAACLQVALDLCWEDVPPPSLPAELRPPDDWWREFAVIAMGKLGGRELNYSSDVDLLFVYDAEWAETDTIPEPVRGYFARLATAFTQALGDLTADGGLFRVDLRLRPQGGAGTVARSLANYATYYESWGQAWERQALIKASPVAGDRALAGRFMNMAAQFVYGKRLDTGGVAEIKAVKRRIEASAQRADRARDVKLGPGCIRDIEFTVQLLQLIFGAQDERVRKKSTLGGLRALGAARYLSATEHRTLASAYVFLRTVEHQLQLMHGLSTRQLPEDEASLDRLARRLGLKRTHGTPPGKLLVAEYRRHAEGARTLFGKLFAEMFDVRAESDIRVRSLVLSADEPSPDDIDALAEYGLQNTGRALSILRRLGHGTVSAPLPAAAAEQFADLAGVVLRAGSRTPDPDASLLNFERFCGLIGSHGALYSVLAEQPEAVGMLVRVAGCSATLSAILARHPEYFDMLMDAGLMSARRPGNELAAELAARLDGVADLDTRTDAILRFRRRELLRIGVRDLMNDADIETTLRELTDVAEVCLSEILETVCRRVTGKSAEEVPFTIIGLGKLGGRELHYNSDLDVMFVWEPSGGVGSEEHELFSRLAEAVLSAAAESARAEGPALVIDARLRPEGQSGPLARSVSSCAEYYRRWAASWERMALTRARAVAGDTKVGAAFLEAAGPFLWEHGLGADELAAILHAKSRIEKERAKTKAGVVDIKLGPGGINDIEFCVQLLQLANGAEDPSLRVPGTLRALRALRRAERLLGEEDAARLEAAYLFLRRVECRLQIVHDWDESTIEPGTGGFERLARLLEYEDTESASAAQRFAQDLAHHQAAAREVFERTVNRLRHA